MCIIGVTRKILELDEAVRIHSPVIRQADHLLALWLQERGQGDAVPQLARTSDPDPRLALERGFQTLKTMIAELLRTCTLTSQELRHLHELRKLREDAQSWWHVYAFALYCFLIIIERYGQDLGRARSQTAREMPTVEPGTDLLAHLDEVFSGQPYHSLSTFIFSGSPRLAVETPSGRWQIDQRGNLRDGVVLDPFAVTGAPDAARGPTSVDTSAFVHAIGKVEILGYRWNERFLSLMKTSASRGAMTERDVQECSRSLDQIRDDMVVAQQEYHAYNRSGFTPEVFALVLRQMTIRLHPDPSDIFTAETKIALTPEQRALLDHFLYQYQGGGPDERLRASLFQDMQRLVEQRGDTLPSEAHAVVSHLGADVKAAAAFLLDFVLRLAGVGHDVSERGPIIEKILTQPRIPVPSGSVSAVHAVADVFFCIEKVVPFYWTHLWNRYPSMTERDKRTLDELWSLVAREGNVRWYERVQEEWRGAPELLDKLAVVRREFVKMSMAHRGVIHRFVRKPARQYDVYGEKSSLRMSLHRGTTGMLVHEPGDGRAHPAYLLASLEQARSRLR